MLVILIARAKIHVWVLRTLLIINNYLKDLTLLCIGDNKFFMINLKEPLITSLACAIMSFKSIQSQQASAIARAVIN